MTTDEQNAEREERERLGWMLDEVIAWCHADRQDDRSRNDVLDEIDELSAWISTELNRQVSCDECGSVDVLFRPKPLDNTRDATRGTLECQACGEERRFTKYMRKRYANLRTIRNEPDFVEEARRNRTEDSEAES